jgi:homoserine kinase
VGVTFVTGPVWARAPATSANLGPGFDALGLALALHDELRAEVTRGGVQVSVTGEGAGELPTDESHLVVRAMWAAFDALGARPAGVRVGCANRIPQARGLGSSSAAIVGGILLARELVADGAERLGGAEVLRLAAELEGHPDNVAPCLLGGFTIAWTEQSGEEPSPEAASGEAASGEAASRGAASGAVPGGAVPGGGARAVSLAPADSVRPVLFVPDQRGLTALARAALPRSVPHAEAALTAGRAALLVHALTAEPGLLFPATEDRLHQNYRAPGMPETAALVDNLRDAGVAAVVSGAGPSVLALSPVPDGFQPGPGWAFRQLSVDRHGAAAGRGIIGHAERDPVAAGRAS